MTIILERGANEPSRREDAGTREKTRVMPNVHTFTHLNAIKQILHHFKCCSLTYCVVTYYCHNIKIIVES